MLDSVPTCSKPSGFVLAARKTSWFLDLLRARRGSDPYKVRTGLEERREDNLRLTRAHLSAVTVLQRASRVVDLKL